MGTKRDVAGRTKLAGEPDPWGRVHPLEHRLLGGARDREARDVAKDADAASRAAAAAAAHMRVRDAVDEARFQHAEAARYANRAVGIGQPDRADPVLPPLSEGPGGERGGERHRQEGERPRALVQKDRVLSRGPVVLGREIARQPCRVLNRHQGPLAALIVAEQRQRRQKHRDRKQQFLHARVERLEPEPEMDPEAAVNPNDQQQNCLQRAEQGREDPEIREYLRISLLEPKLAQSDAGADHVIGQQERNGEAKDELGRLESRPAESAPLVERPEAEAHMRQKRNVEDRRARQRLPDQLLDGEAALHCANRNVAERVIGEMQRHIDVKDEAGREPDLAKAGHCGSICAIAAQVIKRWEALVQSAPESSAHAAFDPVHRDRRAAEKDQLVARSGRPRLCLDRMGLLRFLRSNPSRPPGLRSACAHIAVSAAPLTA